MDKKISIIVPVYNAANTLERCVRSLTEQTYTEIEIILVNDGSKDNSLELCNRLSAEDNRIYVVNQANGGVSSARNAGLDAAHGEFVMFCDSDDWVSPDWCRIMLENHRPQSLTVCQFDSWQGSSFVEEENKTVTVDISRRMDFFHHPMEMCAIWNKLFELNVIQKNQLRFSSALSLGEDFCFVLDYLCAIAGEVRFLNVKLYHYDVSTEESLSKRVPTLEQCEMLYRHITAAMKTLGAMDRESRKTRDWLLGPHLNRIFRDVALRSDLSLAEKVKLTKRLEQSEVFQSCRFEGMTWANPCYLWFFRNHHLLLPLFWILLRQFWGDKHDSV